MSHTVEGSIPRAGARQARAALVDYGLPGQEPVKSLAL